MVFGGFWGGEVIVWVGMLILSYFLDIYVVMSRLVGIWFWNSGKRKRKFGVYLENSSF